MFYIFNFQGLSLAVVDNNLSPVAAMRTEAYTVNSNSYAAIALASALPGEYFSLYVVVCKFVWEDHLKLN